MSGKCLFHRFDSSPVKRLFLTSLLLFILPALAVASPIRVSGSIRDEDGRQVRGARVLFADISNGRSAETSSDGLGQFELLLPGPGDWEMVLEGEGYVPQSRDVQVAADQDLELELTLHSTAALTIQNRVMVVGAASEVEKIPGSAHYLDSRKLDFMKTDFDDIHQFIRHVPGVNFQEEDGYGLRPNIGLRGSGVDRSARITVMEDGVLIAPAPYAAPAAYYFPTSGRMESIEIRKGSSQISSGPRTTGGVLNLQSTSIPADKSIRADLTFGQDRTAKGHLSGGMSFDNFSFLLETYQFRTDGFKRIDGGGSSGFNLQDYMGKFRVHSGSGSRIYQEFELKVGGTTQDSNETYLGLTDEDFRADPLRRYAASQADNFDSRHTQIQGRYFIAPTSWLDLTTTVYRNDFRRNWYKLQSVSGTGIASVFDDPAAHVRELAIIRGEESQDDELQVRANNREYYAFGIETVAGVRLPDPRAGLFRFGFRYHRDEEDRFQHQDGYRMADGRMQLTSLGAPGSQSNRIGRASATAFFIEDEIRTGRLTIVPGLRYESIDLTRIDYAKSDADRTAPTRIRKNRVNTLIPGVGVTFQMTPAIGLFGGVHRGFAPPAPGSSEETDSEKSWNYEAGIRMIEKNWNLTAAGFFNAYSNLLGADTLSSGGTGEGDLFNGGKSRVAGLELGGGSDLGRFTGQRFSIPVQLTYTWTSGVFLSSFDSDFGPWGQVTRGDHLPYLPDHQLQTSVGFGTSVWKVNADFSYVSRMRTHAGQGPIAPREATDAQYYLNLGAQFEPARLQRDDLKITLFVSMRNVTDGHYIVARRPAGARPGLPRTLTGGIRFRFGR